MPRKTKREAEIEKLVEDTYVLKDSWRYNNIGYSDFIIETHLSYDPEDDIIAKIDRERADIPHEEPPEEVRLHELMDRLPKKFREIIWEHYFEGLTFREIGEKRGYSKQNAHELLNKGIVMLREMEESSE